MLKNRLALAFALRHLLPVVICGLIFIWWDWAVLKAATGHHWRTGAYAPLLVQLLATLALWTGLMMLLCARYRVLVFGLLTLLCLSVGINRIALQYLGVQRFEYSSAVWLMTEKHSLGNFLGAYTDLLLMGGMPVLLSGLGVWYAMQHSHFSDFLRKSSTHGRYLAYGMGLCAASLLLLGGKFNAYLPTGVNFWWWNAHDWWVSEPARDAISVPVAKPQHEFIADKIILLVDESVRYREWQELSEPARKQAQWISFGEASSGLNCSAMSKALLRWGTPDIKAGATTLPGEPLRYPTLWQHASAQGYRTHVIDGQNHTTILEDYVNKTERRQINRILALGKDRNTDAEIALELRRILTSEGKDLVYVIKRGIHIPFEQHYPTRLNDNSMHKGQSYRLALSYNQELFFRALGDVAQTMSKPYVMVYTSDHGQDLDRPIVHCNANGNDQEFSVPLMLNSNIPALLQAATASATQQRAQHRQIFPTLLLSMGFEAHALRQAYGPLMWDAAASPYVIALRNGIDEQGKLAIQTSAGFPKRMQAQ